MLRITLGTVLLGTALCATAAGPFEAPPKGSPNVGEGGVQLTRDNLALLAEVRRATAQYHDVADAEAAGYEPAGPCVPQMGTHYVHPEKAGNPAIDPLNPELLLYDGNGHLVGVEYFVFYDGDVPVDTWDGNGQCTKASSDLQIPGVGSAPELIGNHFDGPMLDHGPLALEGVCHFDFHVWVWRANPLGITAHENPLVSCENEID